MSSILVLELWLQVDIFGGASLSLTEAALRNFFLDMAILLEMYRLDFK
jgi:hypothetical protein